MLTTLRECEPSWENATTWDELTEVVAQVEASAGKAGEPALQDVCRLLKERLRDLKETVPEPTHLHRALLRYGSRLIRAYLEGTQRADAIDALVTVLQHPAWVNPLEDNEAKILRRLLAAPPSADGPAAAGNGEPVAASGEADAPEPSALAGGHEAAPSEHESRMDAVSVDYTVEPDDPFDETLHTLPGDEGDGASVDYTVEPDDPFDETLHTLPGGEGDAVPAADAAGEPEDALEQTFDALPQDDPQTDDVPADAAGEREDTLEQTFDALPQDDPQTDDVSADPAGEAEDAFEQELAASPSEGVAAAIEDDAPGSVHGAGWDRPPADRGPAALSEKSEEHDDPREATYADLADDDDDLAADLIRELRADGERDALHETAHDPTARPMDAPTPAESADPAPAHPLQALAEELEDPGQAEADLEALYAEEWESRAGAIGAEDAGGEEPSDAPRDGLAEAHDGTGAWDAPEAPEPHAENGLRPDADAWDEAQGPDGAAPVGEAADTAPDPDQDPSIETLTGALDGLAEEYAESDTAPDEAGPMPPAPATEESDSDLGPASAPGREAEPETADPSGDTLWNGEGWSEAVLEMVQLLMAELTEMNTSIAECVQIAASEDAPAEERRAAMAHAREQFERFGGAAEVIGFEGLNRLCEHIRENLSTLEQSGATLGPDLAELLRTWSERARAYVSDPDDTAACATLARYACDDQWPEPIDNVDELVDTLVSPKLSLEGEDEPAGRATEVRDDDVSLEIPPDVDAALLDGLLQELPVQTAEFTRSIQHLITGGSLEDVEVAQRVAHTLKGAANTVGVPGIANLTHHLEDILLALGKYRTLPGRALGDTLLSAADCLEMMSEALLGQGPGPDDPLRVLQDVLDWANRIDREGIEAARTGDARAPSPPAPRAEPSPEPPERAPGPTPPQPPPRSSPPVEAEARAQAQTAEAPAATAGGASVLRVPASIVDEILRLVGETIILTGQVQERVRRAVEQTHGMQGQFQLLQQLGHELEQLIDLRDVTLPQQRVANADFDPLELDQYNELHTCSRRLVEAATDSREMGRDIEEALTSLDDLLTEQSRLNRESQEAVLHTRMIAVQSIVPRLQRSVRQAGRVAGKSVTLECLGTETLMDGDVLNELVDPLAHILRNSVDHGIEPEQERRAAAKEPGGRIQLEFQREGNHVVVRCADDGRGLDRDAIRRVAERQGLVAPEQELGDDELARLILRPNFTTRSQTTQLSGRGIGMDAVQARVSQLGGSLNLRSEAGRGCTVELRLPLTLISTHALLVRAGRYVFAVSNRGVEQIVHGSLGEEVRMGTGMSFHFEDNIYPLTSLEALLGLHSERRAEERHACPLLLVQSKAGMHAVKVDAVLDSRDLVVKSLGRFVPKLRGIAGATILGDGGVSTVVDLPELLSAPARAAAPPQVGEDDLEGTQKVRVGLPVALVVDDSLSARRSLTQVMNDSGFEVRTARDGLEAIDVIEAQRPDVVLVDLEMPRMNGLELTQHLRAREDTRNLPVVMITSRATEKHRRQAEAAGVTHYLTKPFAEDELLERVTASFG